MATAKLDFNRDTAALLIIDVQPDFIPGGPLACADAEEIIPPLKRLMESGVFRHVAATQDWHPPGHISFAGSHAGRRPMEAIQLYGHEQVLWPDHCLQQSEGARLHPALPWACADVIVRKGADPKVDSYSGFRNNWNPDGHRPPTGLGGYLRDRGIDTVFLTGLARDVCVKWSAEDAARTGFKTFVLWDLTRPVTYESDDQTREDLARLGISIVESARLGT